MSAAKSFDVIVVGVGAMGSAACAHLAARGARVLGLERFSIPHERGSSGGDTRLFRTAYFEHPDYVPLLLRARQGWRSLEERTGTHLFDETGVLYAGRPDGELIPATEASARTYGVEVEDVTNEVAVGPSVAGDAAATASPASRHPAFAIPEAFRVLFEPGGGLVRSLTAIRAFADAARTDGADIRENAEVLAWEEEPNGVAVRTSTETFRAGHLVLCAGAWTAGLAPRLAPHLRVTRQILGWVRPDSPARFVPPEFPSWAIEDPDDGLYYGFPVVPGVSEEPGRQGLKVGVHVTGPETAPDEVADADIVADEVRFRAGLTRYLPAVAGPTTAVAACLYTSSQDGNFLVGPLPGNDRVTVACGFSGHGFKFAPVIGAALADFALEGSTALPVGFLGLARAMQPSR